MIPALLEVLHDLWDFVVGRPKSTQATSYYERAPIGSAVVVESKTLDLSVPAITPQMVEGRTAYVVAQKVYCHQQPKITYDGVVGILTFAQEVKVDGIQNGFAHVFAKQCTGWVHTSQLTDDAHEILPQFKPAHVYVASDEETIKLRTFIADAFLGGQLQLPLQPAEYVQYRIQTDVPAFHWPDVRPRSVGQWQSILRGQRGVHMSVEPKTHSILEYSGAEGRGFLAYTDSVRPDQTIVISSVGRLKDGEYLHEEVSPATWREWRPVFISIS